MTDHDRAALSETVRSRQRQVGLRLGVCAVTAGCFGSALGWTHVAVWFGLYTALQAMEHLCFGNRHALCRALGPVGRPLLIVLLTANSLVFGSISVLEVARMEGWGGACAAFLLLGSLTSTALNTIGCRVALYASIAPLIGYVGLMPVVAVCLYRLSVPTGAGIVFGGASIVYTNVRFWRDWTTAKSAERSAVDRELAERLANEERLFRLAHVDCLTEIANRTVLRARLSEVTAVTGPASLLLVDLDGFKAINDTLGHSAGDEVLRQVASRLTRSARSSDLVARLGGDEFAVLLPGTDDPVAAIAVADQIVAAVSHAMSVDGRSINVGASVGIAIARQHGTSADELYANADFALYRAKAAGRHRSCLYEPAMRSDAAPSHLARPVPTSHVACVE